MNEVRKCNRAIVLSQGIDVLLAIKNTKASTTGEIWKQAMPEASRRTVQRYLTSLREVGFVYLVREEDELEYRYFLTGKAKQLFGATDTQITGN